MAERSRPAGTRLAALLLATLSAGGWLLATAPASAEDAVAVVETVLSVVGTPEPDGRPVELDVRLLSTDPAVPRPAVVLAHGFGGSLADSAPVGRKLARAGYTVLTYTARGFGASGGLIHLDDPAYEGADAVALVDLAATRPEVLRTGDDPVVGFAGASYGGAVSLVAAALDPRIDAIVPAFTWNDLSRALFPQALVDGPARSLADVDPAAAGVFKQRWASLFFLSGSRGGGADPLCGRFSPELCAAYQRTARTGVPDPDLVARLERAAPRALLSRVSAPTLLVQGEQDTLFPLDQADATLRGLPETTPARMVWVAGGHDAQVSVEDQLPEIETWFGRYLRADGSPPDTGFAVTVGQTALVGDGGNADQPTVLSAPAYPGRGSALQVRGMPLGGGQQTLLSPPGGTPAALTSLPGTGPALAGAVGLAGYGLGVLPGQSATFTTDPLDAPMSWVGSSRVTLDVSATTTTATLFASVWDVGPDTPAPSATPGGEGSAGAGGPQPISAVLPGAAVAPLRLSGLTPGRPTRVEVALPTVAHQVPVGHRLRLVVSATDQAYAVPTTAAAYTVALAGEAGLVVPQLTATAASASRLRVPTALVVVVAALALAAVASLLVLAARGRSLHPRPDLAGLPLAVEGLVKTYRDGFKAVDGVSFSAGPGQVVGLLGPNGAGKTTTMRMLVGLIRPDAGAVYVGGQPVRAGAEVLGSVGAFIEGPGFLPHLSGRQNLAAYWQATGRPGEEAFLDEALAVADLGGGLDRRVRGYSQGMRQRLGIAQAMLGRPRLLLLDEPTNGLDPPQILAMRRVLADYAATGRTVLVSSHLLAEVQATCSDVVMMNRGTVVLAGSVADLTASDDVTLVGLASGSDVDGARQLLVDAGLEAVPEDGLLRVSGPLARTEVVARLVEAGFGVESVDGRRRLEEVFMSLVGTGSAQAAAPYDAGADRARVDRDG